MTDKVISMNIATADAAIAVALTRVENPSSPDCELAAGCSDATSDGQEASRVRKSRITRKKNKPMSEIHRTECAVGMPFLAPENVTFGWQEKRKAFSVWHKAGAEKTHRYVILGTGAEIRSEIQEIVATAIFPDGFHAFHLCRL